MAFHALKEAVRFSLVPEAPERIARHTWFPDAYNTVVQNPGIRRALSEAGLELEKFFAIEKTLKDREGRVRIAGEKAGAIAFSEATGEQPIVVFQESKWSVSRDNYFFVPSQHDRLPIDRLEPYQDMLKRVVAEAAFDYVHGATQPLDLRAISQEN